MLCGKERAASTGRRSGASRALWKKKTLLYFSVGVKVLDAEIGIRIKMLTLIIII